LKGKFIILFKLSHKLVLVRNWAIVGIGESKSLYTRLDLTQRWELIRITDIFREVISASPINSLKVLVLP
jgi:hypothetical protein